MTGRVWQRGKAEELRKLAARAGRGLGRGGHGRGRAPGRGGTCVALVIYCERFLTWLRAARFPWARHKKPGAERSCSYAGGRPGLCTCMMLLLSERVRFVKPCRRCSCCACQPVLPAGAGTAAAVARAAVGLEAWRPAGTERLAGGALPTLRAGMPPIHARTW